jgi:hypothetical protein
MKVTIGELVNELMSYSRNIEVNMSGNIPFLKADLGDNSKHTRAHVYIVQNAEHQYSICDYHDDLHGNRYMPTQNLQTPFIKEKKLIQQKYGLVEHEDSDEKDSVVLNLGYLGLLDHFHNLLFQYGVIRVNPKSFNKQINDSEFIPLSSRTLRGLELLFKDRKITNPKIKDLISIVKNPSDVFNIRGIKEKDIKELENKFHSIGINLVIQKNIISDIYFEKIKTIGRG